MISPSQGEEEKAMLKEKGKTNKNAQVRGTPSTSSSQGSRYDFS